MIYRKVKVSGHAIDQWRYRVAVYGNEAHREVLDAVFESRPQAAGELLPPMAYVPEGRFFLRNERLECWFVCADDADAMIVVSVLLDREPLPPVLPKVKAERPRPVIASGLENGAPDFPCAAE